MIWDRSFSLYKQQTTVCKRNMYKDKNVNENKFDNKKVKNGKMSRV